jgi:MFS family permease
MLVFTHHVRLWHLYAMNVLVAIGFWMFFPTVNALIQELTPDDKMLDSNSLLLAALQGGWLMAGAVVGFMYNHVGLGGFCSSTAPVTPFRWPASSRCARAE